jgi:hypothetical protein
MEFLCKGDREMKRFFFACLATTGVLSGSTTFADHGSSSSSSYGNSYGYSSGPSYHDQLRHNSYDRARVHQESHRYPMTSGQHHGLHDQLNHEASHDAQRHRVYDRVFESPYRSNFNAYRNRDTFDLGSNHGWQSPNTLNYSTPNYGGSRYGW